MAYRGQVQPDHTTHLTDLVTMGAVSKVLPVECVDACLRDTHAVELRKRALPSRLMVYYVIMMTIWPHVGYREVLRLMVEGFRGIFPDLKGWRLPGVAALVKARARVGFRPLQELYARTVNFLATPQTQGAWYRKWRLTSLDGTTLDLQDTEANEKMFGRPGSKSGNKSAFPQARLVALCEQGTHVLADAAIGPYTTGEQSLARQLFRSLTSELLVLADRNFFGYRLWKEASETGAALLWRVKKNLKLPEEKELPDGSFLTTIYPSAKDRRHGTNGIVVRVIEYTIDDPGRTDVEPRYRLLTTILDPEAAPADELACLYVARQEIEFTFDEMKTHQRGRRMVLRSKTADGVVQEIYGYLLAHYAIRALMHEAALAGNLPPTRLSFVHTVRVVNRKLPRFAGFSPLGMACTS